MSLFELDDRIEREWLSLARKIRLAQGFCFVVYFVEDESIAINLKERLRESLVGKRSDIVQVSVSGPKDLVAVTLSTVFDSADISSSLRVRRPIWVEAYRGSGEPAWEEQRANLLMRLNERRTRLEAEVRSVLVLLLPAGGSRAAATYAPDLWHIRAHSGELKASTGGDFEVLETIVVDVALESASEVYATEPEDRSVLTYGESELAPWPVFLSTLFGQSDPLLPIRGRLDGLEPLTSPTLISPQVEDIARTLRQGRATEALQLAETLNRQLSSPDSSGRYISPLEEQLESATAVVVLGDIAYTQDISR